MTTALILTAGLLVAAGYRRRELTQLSRVSPDPTWPEEWAALKRAALLGFLANLAAILTGFFVSCCAYLYYAQ